MTINGFEIVYRVEHAGGVLETTDKSKVVAKLAADPAAKLTTRAL